MSKIKAYSRNCHVMYILFRAEAAVSLAFNVSVEPYIIVLYHIFIVIAHTPDINMRQGGAFPKVHVLAH